MNKPNNMQSLDQLIDKCRELKLTALAERVTDVCEGALYQELTFEQRFGVLIDHELTVRKLKRSERCLQRSGLKSLEPFWQAELSKLIRSPDRNLKPELLEQLVHCRWITPLHRNVIVTGACGTGKTWVLATLGRAACKLGITTLYIRYSQLMDDFQEALDHHTISQHRNRINRHDLLIIDDFCSCPADDVRIDALLSLIDERHGQHSVAVASQLSIPDWHAALGGAHAADAIIDRLVPGQSRIELMGKSLRLGKAGPDEL